jgi:hypothetical protein
MIDENVHKCSLYGFPLEERQWLSFRPRQRSDELRFSLAIWDNIADRNVVDSPI